MRRAELASDAAYERDDYERDEDALHVRAGGGGGGGKDLLARLGRLFGGGGGGGGGSSPNPDLDPNPNPDPSPNPNL